MKELAYRQVHLDFHTSEEIGCIGTEFSKKQFQDMLKLGHVNSVTVFSKCHHGWAYYPSKVNEMHPGLKFDLMGAMIDAAHEIGVRTPVYISVGFDEKFARQHHEWLTRGKDDRNTWTGDFMHPGYHLLCLNTPYLDLVIEQIVEVAANYEVDGFFLDIVSPHLCYCQYCINALRREGKDPRDDRAAGELAQWVYENYTNRVNEAIQNIKPGISIFHNGGHIRRGRRDLINMNTHIEIESLPTGGWGYDHFPISVRYIQNLGIDCLGMTGRFHNRWGEFGGYKHINALRYETSLSIANGAGCSIGDQMHPKGFMDKATYLLIGEVYKEVEVKEEWCKKAVNIADIGLLSLEAVGIDSYSSADSYKRIVRIMQSIGNIGSDNEENGLPLFNISDIGAVRILLEGKYLFNVIDLEEDFSKYKVIILPDRVRINDILKKKLDAFLEGGGKVLATGESGLDEVSNSFVLDFGAKWQSINSYKPDYFRPHFKLKSLNDASFVFYSHGQRIILEGGVELGHREDPYFNRDAFTFCSHQHSPNSFKNGGPGMVAGQNGIYIAWNIFEDYAIMGSLILKETVIYALDYLLADKKTLKTNLPAQGIVTLMHNTNKKCYVNHLLYASPIKRGDGIEVIEDIIPVYNTEIQVKIPYNAKKVYLVPQMENIYFNRQNDAIQYIVPKIECHQMVVIDY